VNYRAVVPGVFPAAPDLNKYKLNKTMIIEPVRKKLEDPERVKKKSASLRFWHWATVIIISGSLLTVLANSAIINVGAVPLIKTELEKAGATINDEQARSAIHGLRDRVWGIHTYFGYCLAALFAFRLILEFFQVADQKFIRQLKVAYTYFKTVKEEREEALHELTVKIIYSVFYLLLLTIALTGLFLAFEDELKPFQSIRHSVKSLHNFCMYPVLAFIAVHLVGVFLAEHRKKSRGIVSDMINGGNQEQ
jgi:cytochrome b